MLQVRAAMLVAGISLPLFTACVAEPADVEDDRAAEAIDGTLVTVAVNREYRAAWVVSAWNINWPTTAGTSAETIASQKAELTALMDRLRAARINVVNLQIRPESDAIYPSTLDPFSKAVSGTQGVDPGWDPLAYAIGLAHDRQMELHGWINPFRAALNKATTLAAGHVAKKYPQHAYVYGNYLWMDPGASVVRDHVRAVVRDVVSRYDIDGIVLDDYFYPYPIAGTAFPDSATYNAYVAGGGTLSLAAWRRGNVNSMVKGINDTIQVTRPNVRYGVSPFGIWRPGYPAGVTGTDAYNELYCDAPTWVANGWVDYLAPQLYWPTTSTGQPFVALLDWWAGKTNAAGRYLFPAMDATKVGSTASWSLDEYRAQFNAIAARKASGVLGGVLYNTDPLDANTLGIYDLVKNEYWGLKPAATPVLATAKTATFVAPSLTESGTTITARHATPASVRGFVQYKLASNGTWAVWRVGFGSEFAFTVTSGTWAFSALDKRGVESKGVKVVIP